MDLPARLALPVPFGSFPIVAYEATRDDVTQLLGPFHRVLRPEEALSEPGPVVYWAFRYSCGLEILITSHDAHPLVEVAADLPEPQHIIRHLGLHRPVMFTIENQTKANLEYYFGREFRRPWDLAQRWRLRRQDDNGATYDVGVYHSDRDARCMASELARTDPKQTYWVEPA